MNIPDLKKDQSTLHIRHIAMPHGWTVRFTMNNAQVDAEIDLREKMLYCPRLAFKKFIGDQKFQVKAMRALVKKVREYLEKKPHVNVP